MNKRQKKKKLQTKIPKHIVKLIQNYKTVHNNIDINQGIYGVSKLKLNDDNTIKVIPSMSMTEYQSYKKVCVDLFLFFSHLFDHDDYTEDDWGQEISQFNYRFTKNKKGEYVPKKLIPGLGYSQDYYVQQKSTSEDSYVGTIYIPYKNRFIAYDYTC